ncbi:hypothetical protein BAUCODRAFT_151810 [Baudoinia panamericana UAMH 10762]|uniref:C2H2-type domain-containing protein n=1 Tax=Baudoinia panamericana (strain UAMH 10762) TaxID=717646 RepID=M2LEJ1_BAUPA|nr:uncharacterized protein BAUCODRAFT_151810 [Baudoinia panamericana UAMH 10762]EMC92412.1 hypothetical protein BAUCODRAFT_151810 [Baudoinia panamericana UAMH 10762]
MSHGLDLQPASMNDLGSQPQVTHGSYQNYDAQSMHMDCLMVTTPTPAQYSLAATSAFYQPQIIVPSQLSPIDDFPMAAQYSRYSSPQHGSNSMLGSFASSETSVSGYDCTTPPDVCEVYGYNADDNWVHVQDDPDWERVPGAPVASPSSPILSRNYGYHDPAQIHNARTKRRTPKRSRGRQTTCWVRDAGTNAEMEIIRDIEPEADYYVTMERDGQCKVKVLRQTPSSKKMHQCAKCDAKFERSEHLKRHDSKHNIDRRFHCFLPNCRHQKGISRSDNASDHFKTHLKDTPKGRRNGDADWPTVKAMIEKHYEPERARKLIVNLENWITKKPEGAKHRPHL